LLSITRQVDGTLGRLPRPPTMASAASIMSGWRFWS